MTYRIAEVARRSGFSAATLRYYETIGVIPEPARTHSGYREYDEQALGRLGFIARAKRLGCTLDEIAALGAAWDGGECGPVQDRLQSLVDTKLVETRARIAELTILAAELADAATALQRHRPEGPCDDWCGCITDAPMETTLRLTVKPRRAVPS